MHFSTMVLSMFLPAEDGPEADERILRLAIEQSLLSGELGFSPWYTEHHFRGAWHSNPMQFAAYIAPQLPEDLYLGFGVLSLPYYNPVRLVESMNLLDQLVKGRTLFGLGSGFPGLEPKGMGLDADYHGSGKAAEQTLDIMRRLWTFKAGDPEYSYETPMHRGTLKRRVVPAPYRKRHPTLIRTARRDESVVKAAEHGWPAFLGTFGSDLMTQLRIYRETLAAANHPPEVIEECLRWCTVDWLSVCVADTEEEARASVEAAKVERMAIRKRAIEIGGPIDGPAIVKKPGESMATNFAAGGDMWETIAGTPDQVAHEVQKLADLGINHILVRFLGEWAGETRPIIEKSMRLFSSEVMPRFKHIAPPSHPFEIDLGEAKSA
jgi:alkanesulfonate monooxygenase SsuD/methylene tetrahydromethanopterin reductase-like flavin-dependent oxidoreductase (luciferase family)